MAYNVNGLLDQIKTLLVNNASSLATSLTVSYPTITTDSIHICNPKNISIGVDQYPAIILTVKNKTQEWDEMGINSANKMSRKITIPVDILALVQVSSDAEDADRQARTFGRNIEALLETNIELSDSTSTSNDGWHELLVRNTVYDGSYNESSQTYQSNVRIEADFTSWGVR